MKSESTNYSLTEDLTLSLHTIYDTHDTLAINNLDLEYVHQCAEEFQSVHTCS